MVSFKVMHQLMSKCKEDVEQRFSFNSNSGVCWKKVNFSVNQKILLYQLTENLVIKTDFCSQSKYRTLRIDVQ